MLYYLHILIFVFQSKTKPKRVKAIYNCVADNPDELTFSEGDIIVVDGEEDQEWWVSTLHFPSALGKKSMKSRGWQWLQKIPHWVSKWQEKFHLMGTWFQKCILFAKQTLNKSLAFLIQKKKSIMLGFTLYRRHGLIDAGNSGGGCQHFKNLLLFHLLWRCCVVGLRRQLDIVLTFQLTEIEKCSI